MALKLNKAVAECLRLQAGQRLKARDIAAWIYRTYPEECRAKLDRSAALKSEDDLLQQLVAEVGANRPLIVKANPQIRTVEVRPRLYYWTEESEKEEADAVDERGSIAGKSVATLAPAVTVEEAALFEADLYPLLGAFLASESGLNVQRIDERRSSNKRGPQGNKWLYPDIVALEDLTRGWTKEIRDCVSEVGARKFRLWSLEVKLLLNRSNVREAYFQAVSNSSWANFAYLAAAEIEGLETLKELRILSSLHGVGLIRIDIQSPSDSEVLIPARERVEVDWANCDRLASENSDFQAVVQRLWEFHRTGGVKSAEWKV
ncbi:COG2958 family protein [Sphingomonas sp. Mn802worker]|uniref:COG2958 family protein n=1 Tax=Sphingomonas sp. Mn802worker TaxID=629773 RepID=UPI000A04911B|nr:HrgA protein [Sphingomonas sp. Mn802worker]